MQKAFLHLSENLRAKKGLNIEMNVDNIEMFWWSFDRYEKWRQQLTLTPLVSITLKEVERKQYTVQRISTRPLQKIMMNSLRNGLLHFLKAAVARLYSMPCSKVTRKSQALPLAKLNVIKPNINNKLSLNDFTFLWMWPVI